jgi:hypothetical protein
VNRPDEAVEVLREVWTRQGQASADLPLGTEDSCKSTRSIGFEGLAAAAAGMGEDASSGGGEGDLRAAWRATLRREGKLSPDSETVADLVLGRAAPAAQSDEPRPRASTSE